MLIEIKTLPRIKPGARGLAPRVIVLECDVCHARFERPCSKTLLAATIHRCSLKCVYGSRKSDGLGGHGAAVTVVACEHCGSELQKTPSGLIRKHYFCGYDCHRAWLIVHPEERPNNVAAMQTPEACKKSAASNRARMASPDYVHPMLGKQHTAATRAKIAAKNRISNAGVKNPMHGRRHTDEARAKMSEGHSLALVEGRQKSYGKNGHSNGRHESRKAGSVLYRSSWELACMQWLDENDAVETYAVESLRIPYYVDDHKRWYVPDFLVTFSDGRRELWEVKPAQFIDNERTQFKAAAACAYCESKGIATYRLLTRVELEALEILRSHAYVRA